MVTFKSKLAEGSPVDWSTLLCLIHLVGWFAWLPNTMLPAKACMEHMGLLKKTFKEMSDSSETWYMALCNVHSTYAMANTPKQCQIGLQDHTFLERRGSLLRVMVVVGG